VKEVAMAILSRWNPFNEMQRLTDQLVRGWTGPGGEMQNFAPAVDIYEDEGMITVSAQLPGVKAEDVNIEVEAGVLAISGERKLEREDKREGYHRIESSYGSFTRTFVLPESADADKVEANLSDGVLTLRIPKRPEAAHKRIEVKTKGPQVGTGVGQKIETQKSGEPQKTEKTETQK
jgi:HSP20 family protein